MTNRRTFLKQSSLLASGLMFSRADWLKKKGDIGIQLYTVRNEVTKDLPGTIAHLAAIGYNNVETFGYSQGKYFGLSMADFAALFKKNNLKTPSGHYSLPGYLGKGDEDELKRAVDDSKVLAHDYFTIPWLPEELRKSLDDYKTLADRLNKAGEIVRDAGMKLAYHNHNFEFKDWGGGQTGYAILQEQTDPKLVHFEMDIYWVTYAGQDPIQLIKAHRHRFAMWHVKDMDNAPDKAFTEVGSGIIDYKKIFPFKKLSGMKYFFVEQDIIKIPVWDSVTKSFRYVKDNLVS